jgi:hypothetical protein
MKDLLSYTVYSSNHYSMGIVKGLELCQKDVNDAPTTDAEPVRHGTWETSFEYDWDGNKLYIHFHRECGFEYRNYIEDEQPYCPHCGVKMDGGVSDEG